MPKKLSNKQNYIDELVVQIISNLTDMKSTTTKKANTFTPGHAVRLVNTPAYYFHPDEDFKEDYDWEKNKMVSKINSHNTDKIVLR